MDGGLYLRFSSFWCFLGIPESFRCMLLWCFPAYISTLDFSASVLSLKTFFASFAPSSLCYPPYTTYTIYTTDDSKSTHRFSCPTRTAPTDHHPPTTTPPLRVSATTVISPPPPPPLHPPTPITRIPQTTDPSKPWAAPPGAQTKKPPLPKPSQNPTSPSSPHQHRRPA